MGTSQTKGLWISTTFARLNCVYSNTDKIGKHASTNIFRSITGHKTDYGSVSMRTPDNRTFNVTGGENRGLFTYDCRPVDVPGIYQLQNQCRTVDIFPVNIAPTESDLSAVEIERMSAALHIDDYKTLPDGQSSEPTITTSRYGRELWKIFLWAVVIIMAVEMLLSRDSEKNTDKS